MQYKQSLRNYCQCLKYGVFPDYDMTDESVGDWGQCDVNPFQAERAMWSPKFNFAPAPDEVEPDENFDTPP